ncbi:16S rRNA (cytidine(1402)-2'-O)-methyltransferase [Buchnera aphidicola]|uniref:16S rRNA (cytidine(1402)-2'-O)-methyltransferase n=1 Tax=Buchnera aphidicola TaxID=9 RepID=UPI002238B3F6|nr:16S rRNA (cytidine(1402)-2'-O)-methyltransferase [Buchnera aphidicola]MCW5197597.1 16S rRNA (cytidine(1402)-2'-O)-methyltransferase [Buchnera aphidicola (Chaitophorus viminalis)]
MKKKKYGKIFIIPTPIGNIYDITYRSIQVLKKIDYIAAENYKKIKKILNKFNISKPIISFNQHNEFNKIQKIFNKIEKKKNIALVSDAGTPTINDPGFCLIRECHQKKIKVIPLPGACSAITALSASGIPSNKFCFEGFLPSKEIKRKKILNLLKYEPRTIIFYETPHRIINSLQNIVEILGKKRKITLAKELTKSWESIIFDTAENILYKYKNNKLICKGEIVLILSGYKNLEKKIISKKVKYILSILKKFLPKNKISVIISKMYNIKKQYIYKYLVNKTKK